MGVMCVDAISVFSRCGVDYSIGRIYYGPNIGGKSRINFIISCRNYHLVVEYCEIPKR